MLALAETAGYPADKEEVQARAGTLAMAETAEVANFLQTLLLEQVVPVAEAGIRITNWTHQP